MALGALPPPPTSLRPRSRGTTAVERLRRARKSLNGYKVKGSASAKKLNARAQTRERISVESG